MIISAKGIELVQHFEGLRLISYLDPVGIATIGYGHTGKEVKLGQKITNDEATRLLTLDLAHAEKTVDAAVKPEIEQHQFDALVSLVFNIGSGAFNKSTLLRLLNQRAVDAAADQFLRWDKAGGKTLLGLTHRRAAERQMFLGNPWT